MGNKPKRGRPPKEPSDRRRKLVSVRFRDKTRDQLEELAKESGRPLSQEIESRIEQSFQREELLADVLEARYGAQIAALLVLIGDTMASAWVDVLQEKKKTLDDFTNRLRDFRRFNLTEAGAYDHAVKITHDLLHALGSHLEKDAELPLTIHSLAVSNTLEWLKTGKYLFEPLAEDDDPRAAQLRRLLGPLAPPMSNEAAVSRPPQKKP